MYTRVIEHMNDREIERVHTDGECMCGGSDVDKGVSE